MFSSKSSVLTDIADTINDTVDQVEIGAALERLSDLTSDGVDTVVDHATVVTGPTVALGRQAARNPRKVAAGAGIVVVLIALLWWWKNRPADAGSDGPTA